MKKSFKQIALLMGLVLMLSAGGCTVVGPSEIAVKASLGTLKGGPLGPGVHTALPLVDVVHKYDARMQVKPGQYFSNTSDSQRITLSATVRYKVKVDNVLKAFQEAGPNTDSLYASIVEPAVMPAVKQVISAVDMTTAIEKQVKIADDVSTLVQENLQKSPYIEFIDFKVTGFELDEQVQASIEAKQVAEQELARKTTEIQTAIKEAERQNQLKKGITPELILWEAVRKWDGKGTPPTIGGANVIIGGQ